jgi:hypothetical protein
MYRGFTPVLVTPAVHIRTADVTKTVEGVQ